MEKYGFVYIWYDKKHKRYYVGSHWGTEDDGYICGSAWMHRSKKNRPNDFKRRILERGIERKNLIWAERCWLWFITPEELGKRYYNLNREPMKHWHIDERSRMTVGEKISKCPGRGEKISKAQKGSYRSPEHRAKISATLKGRPLGYIRTEETRAKIAANSRRLVAEGRVGMKGRKHSEETKKKMRENNAMRNPIYRERVSLAKRGLL